MSYKSFAENYYNLGLKPTCISYLKTKYNVPEQNPDKSPCHSWRRWQIRSPSKKEVLDLPWNFANGIGTVLGFTNRCIDIDNCTDENVLQEALNILGLPEKYEWVVKTPNGFHIHLTSHSSLPFISNKELSEGVLSLIPNELYKNKLTRIELRWGNHLVLPPTKLNGRSYTFVNIDFPTETPSKIAIYNIFRFVTQFCGTYEKSDIGEFGEFKLNKLLFTCCCHSQSYFTELVIYDASLDEKRLLLQINDSDFGYDLAPLFIGIKATGEIKDYLDYSTYPRIIQFSYTFGRNSEIFSHYIKPEGFKITKEIENLIGITEEMLLKQGITLNDALSQFGQLYNLPIICHDCDVDIPILDVECMKLMEDTSKINKIHFFGNPFREGSQIYCTSKKHLAFFGGEHTKVREMYKTLFKEDAPDDIHDAGSDVELLRDCFYVLNLYGYNRFDHDNNLIEDS